MADDITPGALKPAYVDWAAIFAGAVLAAALSFVLLTAGAAIGLSLLSADGPSHTKTAGYLAAFWSIAVPIGSLLAGGYIAGRMRPAWGESIDEGDFRDGVHGLLVWGVSILFGAALAMSAAHTAGRVGASAASGALETAQVAAPAVDSLVRSQPGPNRPVVSADQQAQIGRILATSVRTGALSDPDRAYLTQTVAQVTGVPPAEAEKRVTDAYNSTVQAVETARKTAVATGLITATALLLGLAAAWYAAQRGGNHRDSRRRASFFGTTRGPGTYDPPTPL
ncbi:MAG: hypothetical protein Q7T86_09240 [Hyphomicrobiaceae bacterium]|nr:hypothetical protein [Hyphomicrobiaceae bacterium]